MQSHKNAQRNVTQKVFPCPACKRMRTLGETKNGKPYLTCNDCLVQVFFRGKEGIKKLNAMLGKESMSGDVQEFTTLLEHMHFLRKRLHEMNSHKSQFKNNPVFDIEEQIIEMEIKRIQLILSSEVNEKKSEIRALEAARKKGKHDA